MTKNTAKRLHAILANVCPILGVSINHAGNGGTFIPAATATPAQIAAANGEIASFDWSDAAQAAWETTEARSESQNRLGIVSSGEDTPEYVTFRALAHVLLREINALRAAVVPPLAAVTLAQLKTAIANEIDAGSADS